MGKHLTYDVRTDGNCVYRFSHKELKKQLENVLKGEDFSFDNAKYVAEYFVDPPQSGDMEQAEYLLEQVNRRKEWLSN
mgnify:CR=1 FL=1